MNYVTCENAGCAQRFEFTAPSDLMEMRTLDEFDREVAPRREGFVCPKCQAKYTVVENDGEGDEFL